ncbi:MAG: iron donor protein CyaY [Planctomycetota bacterium]|jgi:CyaY protein|nr:iron donor protein CyaY [Planctomycetota bacterium]MDP6762117.1 iron donor protein CyaY [Planctomycetota bacterium]MDP6989106.1 iron donor protein CyaY [Planctomycetota bacterium]
MTSPTDSADFLLRADACLEGVAAWLEPFDPDQVDFSLADGVLTLEFGDGARFVLNRQTAAGQMWLAAGARAWHFDWDPSEGVWREPREDRELAATLAEVVGARLGRSVDPPRPWGLADGG